MKNKKHLIGKVNNFSVPVNSFLVTIEVTSLCTSIPNNKGITASQKIV